MILIFPVSDNKGLDSSIHPEFALTPLFLYYNTETNETRCVSNDGCHEDDYGKASAECAGDLGAEVIIAQEVGCAPVNRLRGFGIEAYFAYGSTVRENIELYNQKGLRRMFSGECDGSCST